MRNQKIDLDSMMIDDQPLLTYAVRYAHIECVKTLVKHQVNIDYQGPIGSSYNQAAGYNALAVACWRYQIADKRDEKDRYMDIIKYIVGCGANCNLRRYNGYTPLMSLCSFQTRWTEMDINNTIELVGLLLDHGADRDLVNDDGLSAWQIAVTYHYDLIANTIRNYQPDPIMGTKGVMQDDI